MCGLGCGYGFGDDRQLGGFPGGETSRHFGEVGEAVAGEEAGGNRGAVSAGAVDDERAVVGDVVEVGGEAAERDVGAAGEVLRGVFAGRADVEDEGRAGGEACLRG